MRGTWANAFRLCLPAIAVSLLCMQPAFGQGRGGTTGNNPGGAGSAPGNTGSTGRGTVGNFPNNFPNTNSPTMQQRPIFLSGKVMFDDGTPPNNNVRIERVCNGNPHLEAHTDSKGRFSFQLGQNAMVDTDASDASMG